MFTFLIGCDQKYYNDWAINLLKSIKHFNDSNDYNLHCHIVNPDQSFEKLDYVRYTFEEKKFSNKDKEIAYLQCARFLAVEKYYPNDEIVVTLDADSICTRRFTTNEVEELLLDNHVLTRNKDNDNRLLAGMIVFKSKKFKKIYAKEILSKDASEWEYGWDQIVLSNIAKNIKVKQLPDNWMSIGKNGLKKVFLTLKGKSQKTEEKYIGIYNKIISKMKDELDA